MLQVLVLQFRSSMASRKPFSEEAVCSTAAHTAKIGEASWDKFESDLAMSGSKFDRLWANPHWGCIFSSKHNTLRMTLLKSAMCHPDSLRYVYKKRQNEQPLTVPRVLPRSWRRIVLAARHLFNDLLPSTVTLIINRCKERAGFQPSGTLSTVLSLSLASLNCTGG